MTNKPSLDMTPAAVARRRAAVDRRMQGVPMDGTSYHRKRREAEQQVETEELREAEAAAAQTEADAERARIRKIVAAGADMDRPRAALRLSLLGPLGPDQARTILSTVPRDQDASEAELALPAAANFGGTAAQAERRRITTIFTHPSAAGRFRAAVALGLEGTEALPPEAITALLAGLPVEAAPERLESLEERAEGLSEFGDDGGASAYTSRSERVAQGWSRAAAEANAMIGAVDPHPVPHGQTGTGSPLSADHPDHPDFGSTRAMEAAIAARGQS